MQSWDSFFNILLSGEKAMASLLIQVLILLMRRLMCTRNKCQPIFYSQPTAFLFLINYVDDLVLLINNYYYHT